MAVEEDTRPIVIVNYSHSLNVTEVPLEVVCLARRVEDTYIRVAVRNLRLSVGHFYAYKLDTGHSIGREPRYGHAQLVT